VHLTTDASAGLPLCRGNGLSGSIARFRDSVIANPFAWFLLVLFVIVEHANYQKGVTITRICELTGPHDVASRNPRNDREELDTICVNRQSDG
jgi:hypothetical protein